jgi:hypothetical protein
VEPLDVVRSAIGRPRPDQVVAFLEDVGLDHHRIADDALDRVPPGIQLRRDVLDDDRSEGTRFHASTNQT